jgi:hypothetical protein
MFLDTLRNSLLLGGGEVATVCQYQENGLKRTSTQQKIETSRSLIQSLQSPPSPLRPLQLPMHKPTKTLPKHLLPPPQPLHHHLPCKPNHPNPKRQLHLPLRIPHPLPSLLLQPLILPPIRPLPHILTRLANPHSPTLIPLPLNIQATNQRINNPLRIRRGNRRRQLNRIRRRKRQVFVWNSFDPRNALSRINTTQHPSTRLNQTCIFRP